MAYTAFLYSGHLPGGNEPAVVYHHGITLAFLFTWVYNNAGGSIFIKIFFPAAINFTPTIIPTIPALGAAERIYYLQVGFNWFVVLLILLSLLRSKIPKVESPC